MKFQEIYDQPDRAVVDDFVRSQPACLLVTHGAGGVHAGVTNPCFDGPHALVHLERKDEQLADLRATRSGLLVFHDVLAVIPSHWVDPAYGGAATAYYRYVELECTAEVLDDPAAMKPALQGLLDRFQPEGGYEPLDPDSPRYAASFRALAVVRFTPGRVRTKWKLGQNRPEAVRRHVAIRLRARDQGTDSRAASEVERWLDEHAAREATPEVIHEA